MTRLGEYLAPTRENCLDILFPTWYLWVIFRLESQRCDGCPLLGRLQPHPQIGPIKARRLLDQFGDLAAAWRARALDLAAAGLDRRALENVLDARPKIDLDVEMDKLARAGVRVLVWDDSAFPRLLRDIPASPFLLYLKGDLKPEDEWSVAVVGTRRASAYGHEATRQTVGDLVRNRITIVSGLARGTDAEVHRAARDAQGRTLAVLGCGVDVIYPPEHVKLA